jgi:hypothetical protein
MYYAGIGSRETPEAMRSLIEAVVAFLGARDWTLRSGGAPGADQMFGHFARTNAMPREIFIPWNGFEDHWTVNDETILVAPQQPGYEAACETVKRFHPAPNRLSQGAFKLMARNAMQIHGRTMAVPVRFVVCWALGSVFDAENRVMNTAGGTGQAVRMAYAAGIRVWNLAVPSHREHIEKKMS